ncbi:MAG: hypothetical protein WD875_04420 [Pirellulales bacterium]
MVTAPRLRWQIGLVLAALVGVAATTGCQTYSIPWEHPTAFKRKAACDAEGPCRNGCYVPPPPTIDSDCYGYRFTCWHPWPEHCQPQCNDGCEQSYTRVEQASPEPIPAAPPIVPPMATPDAIPAAPPVIAPPESTSYDRPSAATTYNANEIRDYREAAPSARYLPAQQAAAFQPAERHSRGASSPDSKDHSEAGAANYGFLKAVAESGGARRDESVRPASRVTRLYKPDATPNDPPPTDREPPRNSEERFRW